MEPIRALALNCTLKRSPTPSSTDRMVELIASELRRHDVQLEQVRVVDHVVAEGVTADEGGDDEWPAIRRRILGSHILVLATPVWVGNPSSVCRKVIERMDAFLGETDDEGRMITTDRVGVVATVGNEDGAHHIGAQLFQAFSDLGFAVPPSGQAYWVGEAMQTVDFRDLDAVPEKVQQTITTLAANAAHLAQTLRDRPFPAGKP